MGRLSVAVARLRRMPLLDWGDWMRSREDRRAATCRLHPGAWAACQSRCQWR